MFLEPWRALSGRIQGLVKAGQLCKPNDSYGTLNRLGAQAQKILADLECFGSTLKHSLPPSAVTAINECIRTDVEISVGKLLHDTTATHDLRKEQVWSALVMLAAFETEVTFILSDVQAAIRARSERAFSHLRRLIVVDAVTREQWKSALNDGEVACEKRGAVHLLWHGIWAFKVNGIGERTDLVFQQPAGKLIDEQRCADGLVLTEWKIARCNTEAQKQFEFAHDQAKRYAQGVLAGSELTAFRYLVVVSSQHVTEPADFTDGAVVYRHINIAVDPETPSQQRAPSTRGRPAATPVSRRSPDTKLS
jgi:hypothetical protein